MESSTVLIGVILAGVFLLWYLWTVSRFKRLTKVLGGTGFGLKATAFCEGIRYQYEYFFSFSTPDYFKIRISCPSDVVFMVTRRTCSAMLLSSSFREIQTHDPLFDRDYFVQAPKDESITAFFQASETRQVLTAIFTCGVSAILLYDGMSLEAKWWPFRLKKTFDPAPIVGAVQHLNALARQISVLVQSRNGV
jgi:hypothetical protein